MITKIIAIYILQIESIANHSDIQVYVTTSKELVKNGIVDKYAVIIGILTNISRRKKNQMDSI